MGWKAGGLKLSGGLLRVHSRDCARYPVLLVDMCQNKGGQHDALHLEALVRADVANCDMWNPNSLCAPLAMPRGLTTYQGCKGTHA